MINNFTISNNVNAIVFLYTHSSFYWLNVDIVSNVYLLLIDSQLSIFKELCQFCTSLLKHIRYILQKAE